MTSVEQPVVFSVSEEKYCVAKLPPDAPIPHICSESSFCSVTKTSDEISVVCLESLAPVGAEVERTWRGIKVQGPLEFSLKGVLVGLLAPLAEANIAVFAVSTYNTDYLFIKQIDLPNAIQALESAGHRLTA